MLYPISVERHGLIHEFCYPDGYNQNIVSVPAAVNHSRLSAVVPASQPLLSPICHRLSFQSAPAAANSSRPPTVSAISNSCCSSHLFQRYTIRCSFQDNTLEWPRKWSSRDIRSLVTTKVSCPGQHSLVTTKVSFWGQRYLSPSTWALTSSRKHFFLFFS